MMHLFNFVSIAVAIVPVSSQRSDGQFYPCNPTKNATGSCIPNKGLLSSTYSIDFTKQTALPQGWTISNYATVNYGSMGAEFTFKKRGDAPQIWTDWTMLGCRYEIVMRVANGTGMISSSVLISDDYDEIDFEFSGNDFGHPGGMGANGLGQNNYFGKGITGSYDRGQWFNVATPQYTFHTYYVDWNKDRIIWGVDGQDLRTFYSKNGDSSTHQFPQTPSKLQIGLWNGGDPTMNLGTVNWAGGFTDLSKAPYTFYVKSIDIVNYTPACAYNWTDQSGSWNSIHAITDQSICNKVFGLSTSSTILASAASQGIKTSSTAGGTSAVAQNPHDQALASAGGNVSGGVSYTVKSSISTNTQRQSLSSSTHRTSTSKVSSSRASTTSGAHSTQTSTVTVKSTTSIQSTTTVSSRSSSSTSTHNSSSPPRYLVDGAPPIPASSSTSSTTTSPRFLVSGPPPIPAPSSISSSSSPRFLVSGPPPIPALSSASSTSSPPFLVSGPPPIPAPSQSASSSKTSAKANNAVAKNQHVVISTSAAGANGANGLNGANGANGANGLNAATGANAVSASSTKSGLQSKAATTSSATAAQPDFSSITSFRMLMEYFLSALEALLSRGIGTGNNNNAVAADATGTAGMADAIQSELAEVIQKLTPRSGRFEKHRREMHMRRRHA